MSDLPQNWEYGKLSQAAHVVRGITFPAGEKRNDLAQGYVCCLRTTNVQQTLEWDDVYYVPTSYVKRAEQLVREGDVLMSMANSYELVGKVARAINVPQPAAFGAFLAAVRPTHAIDGGYLYHFLRSSEVQSRLREGSSQTTNIANISVGRLAELPVPLAPWNEQKRIADKLDTVLTRVDAVNTRLARVAPLLKRFRQSVLESITRSSEPEQEMRDLLHTIRTGPFGSALHKSDYVQGGIPVVNPMHIIDGDIRPSVNMTVTVETAARLSEFRLVAGDVVIGRRGEMGRCAVVKEAQAGWLCGTGSMILRPKADVSPHFLQLVLSRPSSVRTLEGDSVGSTMVNLNQGILLSLRVSRPSIEEQTEIVRRIETLFAFADRLEARLQTAQTAANRLTPALLAKAFRGELVPQDPNDEPASELLKRLAGNAPASVTKRGRKKTSDASA